jgi:hypothetical protein
MTRLWVGIVAAGVVSLGLTGCGGSKPSYPSARLEGKVTIDGQPVAEGRVVFMPQGSGSAQPTQAAISEGRYLAPDVPQGKVLVRFIASKKTGKVTPIPNSNDKIEEVVSIIPAKYEQGMPLEVTGDNPSQDFALTSN